MPTLAVVMVCAELAFLFVSGCGPVSGTMAGVTSERLISPARGERGAPPSVEEIGDRVERVYREAASIHIEGTSSRQGKSVDYTYDGSQDSFRTIAFVDGALYGAFSLHAGRVQEFVPEHPKRLLLTYDVEEEMPDTIPWLVYPRELDCVYGMMFGLWVGPQSVGETRFGEQIRGSVLRGRKDIGGRLCHVLEWRREAAVDPGERALTIRHVYYIDVEDFVIRRWDTYQNEIHQERVYARMELSPEPGVTDWDIWPAIMSCVGSESGAEADPGEPAGGSEEVPPAPGPCT